MAFVERTCRCLLLTFFVTFVLGGKTFRRAERHEIKKSIASKHQDIFGEPEHVLRSENEQFSALGDLLQHDDEKLEDFLEGQAKAPDTNEDTGQSQRVGAALTYGMRQLPRMKDEISDTVSKYDEDFSKQGKLSSKDSNLISTKNRQQMAALGDLLKQDDRFLNESLQDRAKTSDTYEDSVQSQSLKTALTYDVENVPSLKKKLLKHVFQDDADTSKPGIVESNEEINALGDLLDQDDRLLNESLQGRAKSVETYEDSMQSQRVSAALTYDLKNLPRFKDKLLKQVFQDNQSDTAGSKKSVQTTPSKDVNEPSLQSSDYKFKNSTNSADAKASSKTRTVLATGTNGHSPLLKLGSSNTSNLEAAKIKNARSNARSKTSTLTRNVENQQERRNSTVRLLSEQRKFKPEVNTLKNNSEVASTSLPNSAKASRRNHQKTWQSASRSVSNSNWKNDSNFDDTEEKYPNQHILESEVHAGDRWTGDESFEEEKAASLGLGLQVPMKYQARNNSDKLLQSVDRNSSSIGANDTEDQDKDGTEAVAHDFESKHHKSNFTNNNLHSDPKPHHRVGLRPQIFQKSGLIRLADNSLSNRVDALRSSSSYRSDKKKHQGTKKNITDTVMKRTFANYTDPLVRDAVERVGNLINGKFQVQISPFSQLPYREGDESQISGLHLWNGSPSRLLRKQTIEFGNGLGTTESILNDGFHSTLGSAENRDLNFLPTAEDDGYNTAGSYPPVEVPIANINDDLYRPGDIDLQWPSAPAKARHLHDQTSLHALSEPSPHVAVHSHEYNVQDAFRKVVHYHPHHIYDHHEAVSYNPPAEEAVPRLPYQETHLEDGHEPYIISYPPNHVYRRLEDTSEQTTSTYVSHVSPCQNGGIYAPVGSGDYVCICKRQFLGKHCEEINYCHPHPCRHCGSCTITRAWPHYKCHCCREYTGAHCQVKNPCEPNPCLNDGACTHDGTTATCICDHRFIGEYCHEINKCKPNPCYNSGECTTAPGVGKFICNCPRQWIGTVCNMPSQCFNMPCLNGGTCQEDLFGYRCICPEGFLGKDCSDRICNPNPCANGATCLRTGSSFKCFCPPWTRGDLCLDVSPCMVSPCRNGGRCIDAVSGFHWVLSSLQYYCLCPPPFSGKHCEVNYCSACDVNAHCLINKCVCDPGYEGDGLSCKKIITETFCHPNPCHNDGVCFLDATSKDGYGCRCPYPYMPPLCKTVQVCLLNVCHNGGRCIPTPVGFKCICRPGFTGEFCTEVVGDPCVPNPCLHSGICRASQDQQTFNCECRGRWSGKLCEGCDCKVVGNVVRPGAVEAWCDPISGMCTCPSGFNYEASSGTCRTMRADPCSKVLCENGGTCIRLDDFNYKCQCLPGYCGKHCELRPWCSTNPNPCRNGGTCIEVDCRFSKCECPPSYVPPWCDAPPRRSNSACVPNPCQNNGICIRQQKGFDCKCLSRYTGPLCTIDRCSLCDAHARCVGGDCICKVGYYGSGYDCYPDTCSAKCVRPMRCVSGQCQCMHGYETFNKICRPPPRDSEFLDGENEGDDEKSVPPIYPPLGTFDLVGTGRQTPTYSTSYGIASLPATPSTTVTTATTTTTLSTETTTSTATDTVTVSTLEPSPPPPFTLPPVNPSPPSVAGSNKK